jgi:serine/threonine protein kinase/WD40 repeat protein
MAEAPLYDGSSISRLGALTVPAIAVTDEALPPAELVLKLRREQRTGWEQGKPIAVEQILAQHPQIASDGESVLDLIYHEFLLREQFEAPPSLDDFSRRFPEHASVLQMQVAFHRAVQSPVSDSGRQASGDTLNGRPDPNGPPAGPLLLAFPGYEVLDEVGFGGMGVLYRARQIQTNRIVALKVLSAGAYAGPVQRARFRSEAELIARLQHPNIVQIFEASERQGCPFLVLEYVGGGSLRDRLNGTPHSPRAAAEFLEILARALSAAHAAGVVHRDLTPANILFTVSEHAAPKPTRLDAGLPKVSDFGLAKSLSGEGSPDTAARTLPGDVFGTPSYMSPEQAAGRNSDVGPASDIYALGAILYELLTGRPPFRGVTTVETLQLVITAEPVSPARLQPGIPRDLETICLKCLQKLPAERYASAADLAADLRRFLADEPIQARPVGVVTRFVRLCRKKPLLVGLVSTVALLLVVISAGSLSVAVRLDQAAQERTAEAKLAEARVHRLGNQLGRSEKSLAALAEAAHIRGTPEVRDEAIAGMALFDMKIIRQIPLRTARSTLMDFDSELTRYVAHDQTGEIVVREVYDDREICRLKHARVVSAALFSPDGRHLACRWNDDRKVEIWFVGDADPQRVLSDVCEAFWGIGAVSFSRDGRHVAFGAPGGLVRAYDIEGRQQKWERQVPGTILHMAIHPSRPQLAVSTDQTLQIRHLDDGRLLVQIDEAARSEYLTWHPQGKFLATSDWEGTISLWEPDLLRRQALLAGHSMGGVQTAFNHTGSLLFSTAWDGSLRIWDPQWGKLLFGTIGSQYYFLRFSADDRHWAGDVDSGNIRLWELPEAPTYRRLTPEATFNLGYFRTLSISSQGIARGRLLAVSMERGVGFWDLRTGHPLGHLPIGPVSDIVFDDAGNLLTATDSRVQIWPVVESAEGPQHLKLGPAQNIGSPGTLSQLAASANGRVIGLSRRDMGGLILDREGRDIQEAPAQHILAPHVDVRSIALTADGNLAATASQNEKLVKIWNARSGALIRELPVGSSRVAFSPDGQKLLTTANGLEIWSVRDWQPIWRGAGGPLAAHAFSSDGRFVAVDTGTGRIIIYAVNDGQVVAQFDDPYPAALHVLTFASDGLTLAGISRDLRQLFVWDVFAVEQKLQSIGIRCDLTPPDARTAGAQRISLEVQTDIADDRLIDDLAVATEAAQAQPDNGDLQWRCGRLLARLQRLAEARDALTRAVARGAPRAALIELAACDVQLNHWAEGIALIERVLTEPALSPADTAALSNTLAWYLGLAPPELRDPPKSLQYVHRALQFAPANLAYINTLGLALYRQGELATAIETLKVSLRGSSDPMFDLYLLALCHQARGELAMAADYAARAEYLFGQQELSLSRQQRGELLQFRHEFQNPATPTER